jgi:hypothetical protein
LLEETVSTLHGSRYFTTLDCFSGYLQVQVAEGDRAKTAFSIPSGHFQFKRLPFGLADGPGCFQRLMDLVLRNLSGVECWVYLDDIIIFSDTVEEHANRLGHVLHRLERDRLQLNPEKCVFTKPEVKYLGYVVSQHGITASQEKAKAVTHYPTPKNVKDMRSFIGLASFYRRLVPRFAELAKPLTELTKKDIPFKWGDRQQEAFSKLKRSCARTRSWHIRTSTPRLS